MNENKDGGRGNAVRPQNMQGTARESILSAHSIELSQMDSARQIEVRDVEQAEKR